MRGNLEGVGKSVSVVGGALFMRSFGLLTFRYSLVVGSSFSAISCSSLRKNGLGLGGRLASFSGFLVDLIYNIVCGSMS